MRSNLALGFQASTDGNGQWWWWWWK